MVDSQNSLWLAKYNIKVNTVPDSFSLSADVDALLAKPIQVHNFQRELEIVSQYADNQALSMKEKAQRESAVASPEVESTPMEVVKKPTHEEIAAEMKRKTNQDEDVCIFYLESSDWNLDAAIELMESMIR